METGTAHLRYVAQDAPTGYGDAADRLVRTLRAAGVRVEYRGWRGYPLPEPHGFAPFSRDPYPEERAVKGAPTVAHLVPEHYSEVRSAIDGEPSGPGPLIAHTVWETDRLPGHWPRLLDQAQRVIVPTEWNHDTFVNSGVNAPVVVVPHVACDPVPGDGGVRFKLPPDGVVFYTISRWDQRKDPAAVVRAFLTAFNADDRVMLVLKTSAFPQFPVADDWGRASSLGGTLLLEITKLLREHHKPPLVQVEVEDLPTHAISGLHCRGDCFVSMSHGEGWNLGAFDAAAYGNPVITPGWGGPLTWLDADTAYLVEHDVVPVQHFEPQSYSPDQHWAQPSIEHAAELMREVAADLGAARRRAAPLRARVLADYEPRRVYGVLRDRVPELDLPVRAVRASTSKAPSIPRAAHYVWGLRHDPEPFHLVHFLAIASCRAMVQPTEIHLHCRRPPDGRYWELLESHVQVHPVERVAQLDELRYSDVHVGQYSYAHHADFVRLDVLSEVGGLYADLDTLFVAPVPDELWHEDFVIGREADVPDPRGGVPRPALSNAILMSAPGSAFARTWREESASTFDGSWAAHSCFLANTLAERMPDAVHVEPQRTFHAFEPSPEGIQLLLEQPAPDLTDVVAMHLAAHLWWSEARVDFTTVHAGQINEDWIRTSPSSYATAARQFLPG